MKLESLLELVDMYQDDTYTSSRDMKKRILNHMLEKGVTDVGDLFHNTSRLMTKLADDLHLPFDDVFSAFEDIFQYTEVVQEYPMETRIYSHDVQYTSSDAHSDSDTYNSEDTVVDPSNFKYQVKHGMREMYHKMTSLEGMTCLNLGFSIASMMLTFIGLAFTAKLMA